MRKRTGQRYTIRQNILPMIGVCLCFYFSWHIVMGERSLARLYTLEQKKDKLSQQYETLHGRRSELETRVVKLRSNSIDPDLLEERVRYVLGYVRPDERVLLVAN